MDIKVQGRFLKTTPRKLRLVAEGVRNKPAKASLDMLKFLNKAAAKEMGDAIKSALAIVRERDLNEDDFTVKELRLDQGPRLKRRIMKSRGQSSLIQKRMTHLSLIISDDKRVESKKGKPKKSDRAENSSKIKNQKENKSDDIKTEVVAEQEIAKKSENSTPIT